MTASLKRKIILRLLLVGFGLGAPLLLLEILLWFLPVYGGMRLMPLNEANPVLRYTPNQNVIWSKGWNFELVNRLHINNDGFVNNQEYDASSRTPLLAIVGDSYIEAAMVPYAQTVQGRLQKEVGPRGRIYSFGKSGAPLSEYLMWADHARATYQPAALMISVVGNDFDESLNRYKTMQAGHYYVEGADGELELRRFDYEPTFLRRLARQSAMFRYLSWNMHIEGFFYNLRHHDEQFVGNVASGKSEQVVAESKKAVDAFFRDLPAKAGLPPGKILFTLDGMRPDLYDAARLARAENSYFARMRRYFREQAGAKGYEVVDLQAAFATDFAAHRQRFEYPNDNHWNAAAHGVVADAVKKSRVFRSVFGE